MQNSQTPTSQKSTTSDRQSNRETWLSTVLTTAYSIHPLAGDASFRQYFRVQSAAHKQSWMLMDAPPPKEDCAPFIAIAQLLESHHVRVPHIVAYDSELGFVLLEDFGDQLLVAALNIQSVDELYGQAMRQILAMQTTETTTIASYDSGKLMMEMNLFETWFLPYLDITVDACVSQILADMYALIIENCVNQYQVFVHRDFHCRNLMLLSAESQLGVIDFQDALHGPVSYDLVSLLRDAYIAWPTVQVQQWCANFSQQLRNANIAISDTAFYRDFNIMGVQRHLKVLGIFVRLSQRDGKHGYLNDLALVLWYLVMETAQITELKVLHTWLSQTIVPAFFQKLPQLRDRYESYQLLMADAS